MYDIPVPLTLEEIISLGGIEGSEEAYEDDHGFAYSGTGYDSNILYYGGDAFDGGRPFTGLYYERYPDGKLEWYSWYQNGKHIGDLFAFYQSGKIKSYRYYSEDGLNNHIYSFDENGKMVLVYIWENGRCRQETFE